MPRRRRPKFQPPRRRFFWMQWRLQPLRFASPAWQARRANGSAAARRPYPVGTSAQSRGCCSGGSVSAVGGSDSAVIDSRYKPARQRETLGGSTSGYLEPACQGRVVLRRIQFVRENLKTPLPRFLPIERWISPSLQFSGLASSDRLGKSNENLKYYCRGRCGCRIRFCRSRSSGRRVRFRRWRWGGCRVGSRWSGSRVR